jgi:7-cyano-7-deazaguanine reductase
MVTIQYVAAEKCVELKSLKLYYQAFRSEGIYYEAVANKIADDLARAMDPVWLMVTTDWRGRGGIRSRITVQVGQPPRGAPIDGGADDFYDEEEDNAPPPGY